MASDGIHSSVKAIQDMEAACSRFARVLVDQLPEVERDLRHTTEALQERRSDLRKEIATLQDTISSAGEDDDVSWESRRLAEAEEELSSVQNSMRSLSETAAAYRDRARGVEHLATAHSIQAREFLVGAADDLKAYLAKENSSLGSVSQPLDIISSDHSLNRPDLDDIRGSKRPELAAIANDPTIRAAIDSAWNDSKPHTPGQKIENGFWILRNDRDGSYSTQPFPHAGATNSSINPGPKPNRPEHTTVAFFHTHPNTPEEKYTQGPSQSDIRFANSPAINVPGILLAHDGLYYFGPSLPLSPGDSKSQLS